MSIQRFIKKENVDTLWDVIIDEDIFKFLSREVQGKIFQVFLDNIKGFFDVEKNNTTELIDMNKKYILLILTHIKKTYPNQMPNKIKIYNEDQVKGPITYEEIQNEKKTQFEKDLMKRQEDFTNAMALPVPEVPEFSDKFKDIPISEMDRMIKEITAKRNYDVEEINRVNQVTIENADNWLKPQETSVKSEKLVSKVQSNNQSIQENNSRLKYLNLEDNRIIEKNKNVTWGQNEEFDLPSLNDENDFDNDIFKKLKKVSPDLDNISLNMSEADYFLPSEERLTKIEKTLETYNNKIDLILDLLQSREK